MEEPEVRELIVTGPLKERLFNLFSQVYAGRHDVHVVMDRRHDIRRRRVQDATPERRGAERRARPPAWVFPPPD
jgi:hypothetical protein